MRPSSSGALALLSWSIMSAASASTLATKQARYIIGLAPLSIRDIDNTTDFDNSTASFNVSAIASSVASVTSDGGAALGWVYFCLILLGLTALKRVYLLWADGIRVALYQERQGRQTETQEETQSVSLSVHDRPPSRTKSMVTTQSIEKLTTDTPADLAITKHQPNFVKKTIDTTLALSRFLIYRTIPNLKPPFLPSQRPLILPSLPFLLTIVAALTFTTLYAFLPRPLYAPPTTYASPPLAIRAGMLAAAMLPWLIALSMKVNLISMITGIGHERLNVLHRWGGWLCLFLGLVHTVPFYAEPVRGSVEREEVFEAVHGQMRGGYVYGSGVAALVPLLVLCIHSLPWLRHRLYEVFVVVHVPIAILFLATMFWHCSNYLTSWNYLWATLAIWLFSYLLRILFYLNWTNPWRLAWLVGDEASILVLPENAIKVTIATRRKWQPGQYVYLRLPGIAVLENHPFTITSLCSSDFPSEYGEGYGDMTLVFRPFQGFTRKVLEAALENGPLHIYRAFVDGPYGGMTRSLESFDHVLLIAGGSGITALISHLLHLIKRMRQGKAVTRTVQVIWAMKRPDVMSWFKEELRICRRYAPSGSMKCQFFITSAKREGGSKDLVSAETPSRRVGKSFEYRVKNVFEELAMSPKKRHPNQSDEADAKQESTSGQDAASGSIQQQELRQENEDAIAPLQKAHLNYQKSHHAKLNEVRRSTGTRLLVDTSSRQAGPRNPAIHDITIPQGSSMVSPIFSEENGSETDWHTEYGRPDIGSILKALSGGFGRRNCVFVCGPPSMRTDVANAVADLQRLVWREGRVGEVFLHTENYSL